MRLTLLIHTSAQTKLRNELLNKQKTAKNKAGGKAILLGLASDDGSLFDEKQEEAANKLQVDKRKNYTRPEGESSEPVRKRQRRHS